MHEAGEQIAAAERRQAERGEPLEPFVQPDPDLGQHPEGGVVADEPLGVAAQAAGEREELHADDRERDRGLLWALSGAGDQPGGRRDQPDRGGDRAGSEQRRKRQPGGGRPGDRERAQQRRRARRMPSARERP